MQRKFYFAADGKFCSLIRVKFMGVFSFVLTFSIAHELLLADQEIQLTLVISNSDKSNSRTKVPLVRAAV